MEHSFIQREHEFRPEHRRVTRIQSLAHSGLRQETKRIALRQRHLAGIAYPWSVE